MRTYDPNKERREKRLSIADFKKLYNESLPPAFPCASIPLLRAFKKNYPGLFKDDDTWSLEQHRKKFMDWLPQYIRTS